MEKIIKPACLAWCKDEDDLVVIFTLYKERIILNTTLSFVWETIVRYKQEKRIIEQLNGRVSKEKFDVCITYLREQEIIKIYEENKLFDLLFA